MTKGEAIRYGKNILKVANEENDKDAIEFTKMAITALKQQPRLIAHSDGSIEQIIEPCRDAISREAAIRDILEYATASEKAGHYAISLSDMKSTCEDILSQLPAKQPKAKVGHWMGVNPMVDTLMCSECGENIISEEFKSNYCPNCGARMVEPQESEE